MISIFSSHKQTSWLRYFVRGVSFLDGQVLIKLQCWAVMFVLLCNITVLVTAGPPEVQVQAITDLYHAIGVPAGEMSGTICPYSDWVGVICNNQDHVIVGVYPMR